MFALTRVKPRSRMVLRDARGEVLVGGQAFEDGRLVPVDVNKGVEVSSDFFDDVLPAKTPGIEEKDGIGWVQAHLLQEVLNGVFLFISTAREVLRRTDALGHVACANPVESVSHMAQVWEKTDMALVSR